MRDDNKRQLVYLRDLLHELVIRDMKVRYKHSILGFVWSLLNPLLHMLVFYFIFRLVLSINVPRYSAYVFSGLLVYDWFQNSLFQAADAITGNAELIRRPGFPVVLLPIVTVITNLLHFLLALPALIPLLLIEGGAPGKTILALPIVVLLQFVLTLGLAYLVAGVNVSFRDVQYLLSVLLRLFFFLTPIFYDSAKIPERFLPFYRLNPLVPLVTAYRAVLIEGTQPDWLALLVACLLAVGFLYIGYNVFMRLKYRFVEEL